jgi:hypothetical protein
MGTVGEDRRASLVRFGTRCTQQKRINQLESFVSVACRGVKDGFRLPVTVGKRSEAPLFLFPVVEGFLERFRRDAGVFGHVFLSPGNYQQFASSLSSKADRSMGVRKQHAGDSREMLMDS